jgi:Pyridoxamine 5'-phosphate oxidase
MKLEDLLLKIDKEADRQYRQIQLERMNLPISISDIEKLDPFDLLSLRDGASEKIAVHKVPGSEGEHLLQAKYQTQDRAARFYKKQLFGEFNRNMRKFIRQTHLSFVSTWEHRRGCNIQLNVETSYVLNANTLIIPMSNYKLLENIETNPHITIYYLDFLDKRVGLHVNGKTRILTAAEILISSAHPGQNLYGIPGENIPLELIIKAKINPEGYWAIVRPDECYIHCSKHILAHKEIEKKITATEISEPSTLEIVKAQILKAEMFILATADRHGETDCSLRAGPSGFIQIHQGKIRYPEYRGNGVLASLGNIIENSQVAISIFNLCSTDEKTIFIQGTAKIVDEEVSTSIDNSAKNAVEHWVEITPTKIEIRQEKARPLYERLKDRKVPWGSDDDTVKKSGYFIEPPRSIKRRGTY